MRQNMLYFTCLFTFNTRFPFAFVLWRQAKGQPHYVADCGCLLSLWAFSIGSDSAEHAAMMARPAKSPSFRVSICAARTLNPTAGQTRVALSLR